jgi:hypothetical protein
MNSPKRQSRGKVGTTVALLLVLLIGLGAFLRWAPIDGEIGLRQEIQTAERPGAESPSPGVVNWRATAQREFKVRQTEIAERPSRSTEKPAPESPPIEIARPTVPTAADIPVGLEKSKLLASFGSPNMVTTAVEQGQRTETYFYLRPDAGTQIIVQLKSGKVVGARSTPY